MGATTTTTKQRIAAALVLGGLFGGAYALGTTGSAKPSLRTDPASADTVATLQAHYQAGSSSWCDTTAGPCQTSSTEARYVPDAPVPTTAAPATTAAPTTTAPVMGDTPPSSERIQEDDPRWDCRIHGNRICGPTTTVEASPAPAVLIPAVSIQVPTTVAPERWFVVCPADVALAGPVVVNGFGYQVRISAAGHSRSEALALATATDMDCEPTAQHELAQVTSPPASTR